MSTTTTLSDSDLKTAIQKSALDTERKNRLLALVPTIPDERRPELMDLVKESQKLARQASDNLMLMEKLNEAYGHKLSELEKRAIAMVRTEAEVQARAEESTAIKDIESDFR